MIRYLTVEQVLFLHARLIEETGGSHGLRDPALLQSAVSRPAGGFGDQDPYPDLFAKAAALMESLIRNRAFVDGNKRTGVAASALILRQNGYRLMTSSQDLEVFTLRLARSEIGVGEIAAWLETHSVRG